MRGWIRAAWLALAFVLLTAQSSNPPVGTSGSGTVTSVTCGAGLSGGTITSAGTCLIPGGGVLNSMLANSSITIAGHAVSLGGSQALVCGDLSDALTGCTANIALYAPLASPTFTGTPAAPSAAVGTNTTQLATTAYVTTAVNNAIAAVNPAIAVQAATTAAGDTSGLTYLNGVAGIGATLTGIVNTALTIDGFTFTALGQRLLVKNDTQAPSGAFNGVYYVTQIQTAILAPILTRALDYDMPSDINNTGAIPVINGTVNGTTQWVITSTVNTVGTDPLTFAKFSINPSTICSTTVATWTASGTIPAGTGYLKTSTISAAETMTMPAASGYAAGCGFTFDDTARVVTAAHTSTFNRAGSDTFSGGGTSYGPLTATAQRVQFTSDGVSKFTVEAACPATTLATHNFGTGTGIDGCPTGALIGAGDLPTIANNTVLGNISGGVSAPSGSVSAETQIGMSSCTGMLTTAVTRECLCSGNAPVAAAPGNSGLLGAKATITQFHAALTATPGAGNTHAFSLIIGGVTTATCSITGAGPTTCDVTGLSIAAAAGAVCRIQDVGTGTPAASTGSFGIAGIPTP